MDFHDTIIEFFLYHGIARVHRGFGDTVELAGRFLDTDRETLPSAIREETARHLKGAIEKRAAHIADYYGGKAEIAYTYGAHPPLVNDARMTARVAACAESLLGHRLTH